MDKRLRILLVDDHPVFRAGVQSIIDCDSRHATVGQAGTGEEALALAEGLDPDLAVVDVKLDKGGMDGLEFLRRLHVASPRTRVVMLSVEKDLHCVEEALKAGAAGYVTKESAGEQLLLALDAASRGGIYLDPTVSAAMARRLRSRDAAAGPTGPEARYASLTPREREVMRLIVEGQSSRQIAEKLFLSPKTVENHRSNLMAKLQVTKAVELVRTASRLGLLDQDR